MPNVMSRVAPAAEASAPGQPDPVMQIAGQQLASMSILAGPQATPPDKFRILPPEIRVMVYELLLCARPNKIYRGAKDFGPLNEREFEEEFGLPWQILATCRTYYCEAAPIMYSKNRFVFCTGKFGEPGTFWNFPIPVRFMQFLTDLGIYLRCGSPTGVAAKRVAGFITAIARRACKLKHLTVLISASTNRNEKCSWDIMFCDHPVAKAIIELIEVKTVTHLKIRLHDDALLYSGFASFLQQTFHKDGPPANRSLVFSRSRVQFRCLICDCALNEVPRKPVEEIASPKLVEAGEERTMQTQDNLYTMGLLPLKDDDEEVDDNKVGPYGGGPPIEDDYEENRKAFHFGMLLPGEVQRFRSKLVAPKVWFFKQTKMTKFFKAIEDNRVFWFPLHHQCGAGQPVASNVWFFRQTEITNYFKVVDDDRESWFPVHHQCGAGQPAAPKVWFFKQTKITNFFKAVKNDLEF